MACHNSNCGSTQGQECCQNTTSGTNFNFVIIVVLYILLAIILGSWIWY